LGILAFFRRFFLRQFVQILNIPLSRSHIKKLEQYDSIHAFINRHIDHIWLYEGWGMVGCVRPCEGIDLDSFNINISQAIYTLYRSDLEWVCGIDWSWGLPIWIQAPCDCHVYAITDSYCFLESANIVICITGCDTTKLITGLQCTKHEIITHFIKTGSAHLYKKIIR